MLEKCIFYYLQLYNKNIYNLKWEFRPDHNGNLSNAKITVITKLPRLILNLNTLISENAEIKLNILSFIIGLKVFILGLLQQFFSKQTNVRNRKKGLDLEFGLSNASRCPKKLLIRMVLRFQN
jgi:hypothetical protein